MPLVRFVHPGAGPRDGGLEELDMAVMPNLGDRIVLDYADYDDVVYEVVGRGFQIAISKAGGQLGVATAYVEVRRVSPSVASGEAMRS
ncbi:MAG TPA: hypothetical protein VM899_00245 [Rubellimicrobium sp.]|nr:hypothetical protein [Rubellimicrobium sp.]